MTPNIMSRDANRQLALFVGAGTDALSVVEPILDGRAYDVEFVDNDDEPYGTITALKPDLVVVTLRSRRPGRDSAADDAAAGSRDGGHPGSVLCA